MDVYSDKYILKSVAGVGKTGSSVVNVQLGSFKICKFLWLVHSRTRIQKHTKIFLACALIHTYTEAHKVV